MSTDNEWNLDEIVSDSTNIPFEDSIKHVFSTARERLDELDNIADNPESKESIERARKDLQVLELLEKLDLATFIIDRQKAEIARLKGDN